MDIYDRAEWAEMDIEDLKAAIEHGRSIEEAAEFLCRVDRVDDVARKCIANDFHNYASSSSRICGLS
jgi:hypothetical protein